MIEKVNPSHPDKIADRIAGAIVDLGYIKNNNPKIAVEVLIGHGVCHTIIETSENYSYEEIEKIVKRIGGNVIAVVTVVIILGGNRVGNGEQFLVFGVGFVQFPLGDAKIIVFCIVGIPHGTAVGAPIGIVPRDV